MKRIKFITRAGVFSFFPATHREFRRLAALVGLLSLAFGVSIAQAPQKSALNIGQHRQLFIDDFVIESSRNLKRVPHRPVPHPSNPIMTGTEKWERWLIGVNGRAVIYDEDSKEFKMWYGAYSDDPAMPYGQGYRVCYAVSKDGVDWTRPDLGQVEWEGSRRNNILSWGNNWMRRPNVIKDTRDPDPNRRYKMTYVDVIDGKNAIVKAYSRDGIRWTTDGLPWFRHNHSSNLLGWDPRVQQYVLFPRMAGAPTSVGRSTSSDFRTWSDPVKVLGPEAFEVTKAFKGNAAFFYEDLYLGFLWVFDRPLINGTRTKTQVADTELVFSRDGLNWQRPFPDNFFLPRGKPGTWDREGVLAVAPVIYQDKIWIYYSGWNHPYGGAALKPVQEGWIENGERIHHAIGLATLRLDGFVSLDAGNEEGIVTTKPLKLSQKNLMVNADVQGELRIEILDESGKVIPGFSKKDCDPIRSDNVRHVVSWKGKSTLSSLHDRALKLRFILQNGSLYSFGLRG